MILTFMPFMWSSTMWKFHMQAGVEADAVSYNMLFSACSKSFLSVPSSTVDTRSVTDEPSNRNESTKQIPRDPVSCCCSGLEIVHELLAWTFHDALPTDRRHFGFGKPFLRHPSFLTRCWSAMLFRKSLSLDGPTWPMTDVLAAFSPVRMEYQLWGTAQVKNIFHRFSYEKWEWLRNTICFNLLINTHSRQDGSFSFIRHFRNLTAVIEWFLPPLQGDVPGVLCRLRQMREQAVQAKWRWKFTHG